MILTILNIVRDMYEKNRKRLKKKHRNYETSNW